MTQRYQLTADCYMALHGQWVIVQCGSVVDVPDAMILRNAIKLSPTESAGATPNNQPTGVRNIRLR